MKKNIQKIVIISDCTDIAFLEMRQTVINELQQLGIERNDYEIDPLVPIVNFSVVHAAFSIRLLADLYPAGTIFLVVVHGVNSNPERIYGEFKNGIRFIGNNSGYFNWTINDIGLEYVYENFIDRNKNGKSFGGKYVQAPMVAKLLSGKNLTNFGELRDLGFISDFKIQKNTVVHIDNFGLMKIYAPSVQYKEGQKLKILVNGAHVVDAIYTEKLKRLPDGEWAVFNGSSLHLMPELGKVRALHSASEINVSVGDVITWELL